MTVSMQLTNSPNLYSEDGSMTPSTTFDDEFFEKQLSSSSLKDNYYLREPPSPIRFEGHTYYDDEDNVSDDGNLSWVTCHSSLSSLELEANQSFKDCEEPPNIIKAHPLENEIFDQLIEGLNKMGLTQTETEIFESSGLSALSEGFQEDRTDKIASWLSKNDTETNEEYYSRDYSDLSTVSPTDNIPPYNPPTSKPSLNIEAACSTSYYSGAPLYYSSLRPPNQDSTVSPEDTPLIFNKYWKEKTIHPSKRVICPNSQTEFKFSHTHEPIKIPQPRQIHFPLNTMFTPPQYHYSTPFQSIFSHIPVQYLPHNSQVQRISHTPPPLPQNSSAPSYMGFSSNQNFPHFYFDYSHASPHVFLIPNSIRNS